MLCDCVQVCRVVWTSGCVTAGNVSSRRCDVTAVELTVTTTLTRSGAVCIHSLHRPYNDRLWCYCISHCLFILSLRPLQGITIISNVRCSVKNTKHESWILPLIFCQMLANYVYKKVRLLKGYLLKSMLHKSEKKWKVLMKHVLHGENGRYGFIEVVQHW